MSMDKWGMRHFCYARLVDALVSKNGVIEWLDRAKMTATFGGVSSA
jgi:hypothetical protein